MLYVYCDRPSTSANVLKRELRKMGRKAQRLYGLRIPTVPGLVINWGSPRCALKSGKLPILNEAGGIRTAMSKVATAEALIKEEVPCVRITRDSQQADKWLKSGHKVLLRRDGLSSGRGIVLYTGKEACPANGFFTRVFNKTHEFRVHVCRGKAIDFTQKKCIKLPNEVREMDRLIRTHANGWVFAHDDIVLNPQDRRSIEVLAVEAVTALGLDFGAVDVLAILTPPVDGPRRLKNAVVCEINTRPGLENTKTIAAYASAFINPGERPVTEVK